VFAIPALNKDVSTFDNMALALHYHMFQYVVIANNGEYGGSNAHAPFSDANRRKIFHLHGQAQASTAFFEIEESDLLSLINRKIERITPIDRITPHPADHKFVFKSPTGGSRW